MVTLEDFDALLAPESGDAGAEVVDSSTNETGGEVAFNRGNVGCHGSGRSGGAEAEEKGK